MHSLLLTVKYSTAASWHNLVLWHDLKYHVITFEPKALVSKLQQGNSYLKIRRGRLAQELEL